MDVIGPERMFIDAANKRLILGSCQGLACPLAITADANQRTQRPVRATGKTIIPPHTVGMVSIEVKGNTLPPGTYLFEPRYSSATRAIANAGGTYAHVVDQSVSQVQIANDSNEPLIINHHIRLGDVVDLAYEGCYHSDPAAHTLAARVTSVTVDPGLSLFKPTRESTKETTISNGITIYGDIETVTRIQAVANQYPEIWINRGTTVNVPEAKWMEIPLINNWMNIKLGLKVYLLSTKDREVVDKEFNSL